MDQERTPTRREAMVVGALFAAIGFYFVLVSLGLLPPPSEVHVPMWVMTMVALCFLLGGLAVLIPVAVTGEVRADGELPPDAPQWLRVLQYLFGLALFGLFAMIGSFVAFGSGVRSFDISLSFLTSNGWSEIIGRIAFGIGALITWFCLIAFAVHGWRKLVRGRNA
jgi:hypothetical protein